MYGAYLTRKIQGLQIKEMIKVYQKKSCPTKGIAHRATELTPVILHDKGSIGFLKRVVNMRKVLLAHTNIKYYKLKVLFAISLSIGMHRGFAAVHLFPQAESVKLIKQSSVSGRVTNMDGIPVVGATVQIKNTKKYTTTDSTGSFEIDAGIGNVLLFSMIGYERLEMQITDSKTLNVSLHPSVDSLDEVVVVGYGMQKVENVTSAIATVKAKEFLQGGVRNPLDLIRGKIAGLSITRSGGNNNPNAGPSIQLRGVTSLTGGNSPLVVIDGIPGGDLNLLQQDDIESIDVLKDGSAAAIYGTRGNAGVILITTKKGKSGAPRYDYSTYISHDIVRKRPEVLSGSDYRSLKADPNNPYAQLMADLGDDVDYFDLLLDKNNLTHYHNLAASGGSTQTNYRISVNYSDNQGIALQNDNEQYGGRINVNHTGLGDRLHLYANLSTNIRKQNLNGGNEDDFGQAIHQNPTQPVFNTDGSYNVILGNNHYYNPIARLNQEKKTGERTLFSGDMKLSLDILSGLKANVFGAIVRNNYLEDQYRLRASKSSIDSYQGGGYAYKYSALTHTQTLESTIDYNKNFGRHGINSVLGYSYQIGRYQNFNAANSGFLTDAFEENNLGAGTDLTAGRASMGSTRSSNKLIAFFGRVNYNFGGKYLASFILRREGSSRFGANHKWGNFPAISIGWNIFKEDFMSELAFVNTLKLRTGYGITGNQEIDNYQSLVTLGTGGQYLNNGIWFQTYGPNKNPNENLRWERKQELNIGVDFGLFSRRLTGSVDWYRRKTVDLLANYNTQVPPFVTNSVYTNVGTIQNKGIELAFSGHLVDKRNLHWTIDFTGNYQKNELESISDDVFKASYFQYGSLPAPGSLGYAIRTLEGGPLGSFYGKRFAGFNEEGKWLFYKADGSRGLASEMTTEDLTFIGNGVPKYMASLGSSLRYRNWDINILFRGKFDFDVLNTQDLYFGNKKWLGNNILKNALTTYGELLDDPQYSDIYLEKGDFVKLDNITVGYNFLLSAERALQNLRIYASAQNLAVFTSYSGLDPEQQDTGLTTGIQGRGFYPQTRTFTIGVNIGF